jgi:hypothetical protein
MAGFSNPIIGGGGGLVYPSIHSPNFITGVSGWTINKDGSAQFNNLTIRGVFEGTDFIINSAGAFFYSGTPAAGNLVTSITSAAGSDQFGNSYEAGVQIHSTGSSGANINLTTSGGVPLGFFSTGAAEETTAANIQALITDPGSAELLTLFAVGPQIATYIDYVNMQLNGPSKDGADTAGGALAYSDRVTGTEHLPLEWGAPGVIIYAGTIGALEPGTGTASVAMVQETLHALTPLTNGWAGSGNGVNGFNYELLPDGTVYLEWDLQTPNNNPGVIGTLPAAYRPSVARNIISGWYGTGPVAYNDQFSPHFAVGTNGAITPASIFVGAMAMFGTAIMHL